MPKAFNELEKETIRKNLMEKGRELFGTYGLKKTSVGELTKAVNIAQGSFYIFFPSKEDLYLEILEEEEKELRQKLFSVTPIPEKITKLDLKNILKRSLELAEANPIIRRIYREEEYQLLLRKIPKSRLEALREKDIEALLALIKKWQQDGLMIPVRPDIIASTIRSVFFILLHKQEIGENIFSETINLLLELIARGLLIEQGEVM